MSIDISGVPKDKLLAGLFNAAMKSQCFPGHDPSVVMTEDEARQRIEIVGAHSRVAGGLELNVDFSGDELDAEFYDGEYGEGTAQAVVDALRAEAA